MTKVILDDALRSKLRDFRHRLEICDETGRIVGYFLPAVGEKTRSPISDEKLERRRKEPADSPLAEVWARLGR
jgi:hypothetical protein